jgi:hypothetical protein
MAMLVVQSVTTVVREGQRAPSRSPANANANLPSRGRF